MFLLEPEIISFIVNLGKKTDDVEVQLGVVMTINNFSTSGNVV